MMDYLVSILRASLITNLITNLNLICSLYQFFDKKKVLGNR